ncbi:MAG: hypothetical protein WC827_02900 [Candidatus Paceibacterota bacterium]|jgi:gas vesicle protein
MPKTKKIISVGKVAAVGAGVAAVSAGAYYLFGPKGKQHQRMAKNWLVKMEKDIEIKIKKAKSVTKPIYHGAVDAMAKTYSKQYKEYSGEINAFAKKLKNEWKDTEKKVVPAIKKTKSVIKKTIKKSISNLK